MRILSLKPGHDGAIAQIDDGVLTFNLEPEKDSFPRHGEVSAATVLAALEMCDGPPDVLAIGGWHKTVGSRNIGQYSGYFGLKPPAVHAGSVLGRPVRIATSSHERSHVLMAAAMSSQAPLRDCIVLVWEGVIGAFYRWSDYGRQIERIHVMSEPGARYSSLYALADPNFSDEGGYLRDEYAGKVMALAGLAGDAGDARPAEHRLVQRLMEAETFYPFDKRALEDSPIYNASPEAPAVCRAARLLSDQLFARFEQAARTELAPGLPLLIAGGCALNCEWNRRWRDSGLFSSVEVFPCGNDSGSAIGTAIDAGVTLGGEPRLQWSVYAGAEFEDDAGAVDLSGWHPSPLDFDSVARRIDAGAVVAWVQGRAEMGPRALGHRSLLASPLVKSSHDRLNEIKRRESYRPIAPCCLLEEQHKWFDGREADPYMLYFARVLTDALPAVTHHDGTARLQSVGPDGPTALRSLLRACSRHNGYGVLCNTSLNYPGSGFINRLSDLIEFSQLHRIDDVVIDDTHFVASRP